MLKGIPHILSPQLLSVLCAMGHGDEIILADGNFPAESFKKHLEVVRCDGHGIPELLEAILKVFPLDSYVEQPITLMDVVDGDDFIPLIWETYESILSANGCSADRIKKLERFAFYEHTKNAFAVVATGELSQYANISIKKGIVKPLDVGLHRG